MRVPDPPLIDGLSEGSHVAPMNNAATVELGNLIQRSPGIKHGGPHIAGTGVLVRTIARWSEHGLLPEEIALSNW
jgi:uncharacterized protein (DUF433 family)